MGNETMYVSYAKDIFIRLLDSINIQDKATRIIMQEVIMQEAINLVKQAREAFS